jgi:phosphoribosyl 1,2-cyclic phosphodiesterase
MHSGRLNFETHLIKSFNANESVRIGQLSVTAFPKFHDASDPYSFVVSCNRTCVGVFTDIGKPCQHLIKYFQQCHAAFLESNYDEEMLDKGNYPIYLKNRIRGGRGHLSNQQAFNLFLTHRPEFMTHLLLSHLSKNNNRPELVYNLFSTRAGSVNIVVASRDEETQVYHITGTEISENLFPEKKIKKSPPVQLSLAFV